MASLIDEMVCRRGTLHPDAVGIHSAFAADLAWHRDRGETERDFLSRVRRDGAAAGYRIVHFSGAFEIDNVQPLLRPSGNSE